MPLIDRPPTAGRYLRRRSVGSRSPRPHWTSTRTGAYTNAYDAARLAATALLTQQGLRPTTRGGHRAVEEALLAQFGQGFAKFGVMRRRRHELDYPAATYTESSREEAEGAVGVARLFLDASKKILAQLGFFDS